MLDFGVLPPEITSTQMYSGPGSAPMMAAASAWDMLAGQVSSFAEGYDAAIAGLSGEHWAGTAAAAMETAAQPYVQWAASTALQAEQAAVQLRAAATAFETAHVAITPPAVVAANRIQLANLIATNILGHNAGRIAATEAAYQAMWAQNTHTMYGYAGSASSATRLSPFKQAPETTKPAGQSAAAAASAVATSSASSAQALSQSLAAVPQQLAAAGTPQGIPVPQWMLTDLGQLKEIMDFNDGILFDKMRLVGSVSHAALAWIRISSDGAFYAPLSGGLTSTGLISSTSSAGLAAETAGAGAGRAVLAGVGEATTVGRLSAPPAWANATPVAAVNDQMSALVKGTWETTPKVSIAGGGPAAAMAPMAQAALAKQLKRPSVSTVLQVTPPRYTVPRHSSGG